MTAPVRYQPGSFLPAKLDWPKLIPLLGPASAAVLSFPRLLNIAEGRELF